jgi:Sec-independent protein translocase protein TatA
MNFGTTGTLEILVIGVIAFIILGPKGFASSAKKVGTALGHLRKVTKDISQLTTLELYDEDKKGDSSENIDRNLKSNKTKQD